MSKEMACRSMWPEDWTALAFEKQVHGQIGPAISHNEAPVNIDTVYASELDES